MTLSQSELIDLLERAHNAGCFEAIVILLRNGAPLLMIEKVIQKTIDAADSLSWLPDDFFA